MSAQFVTRASTGLVLVSFALFLTFYLGGDYQFLVLGMFMLVFGIGHLRLAQGKLNAAKIRLMDFAYVSCACFAAFIGFQSAQSRADRDPSLRLVAELHLKGKEWLLPYSLWATPGAIAAYARQGATEYCANPLRSSVFNEPKLCDWAEHIAAVVEKSPTDQDLERLYGESKAQSDAALWAVTAFCLPPPGTSDPANAPAPAKPLDEQRQQLCSRAVFADGLLQALDIMIQRSNLRQIAPAQAAAGPTLFGLTKALLWPLILAVALALRMTKATADVTGWAK